MQERSSVYWGKENREERVVQMEEMGKSKTREAKDRVPSCGRQL
jgi:hypothetical protein